MKAQTDRAQHHSWLMVLRSLGITVLWLTGCSVVQTPDPTPVVTSLEAGSGLASGTSSPVPGGTRLNGTPSSESEASPMPCSQGRLIFVANTGSSLGLYTVCSNGEGLERVQVWDYGYDSPAVSAAVGYIAYADNAEAPATIRIIDTAGRAVKTISESPEYDSVYDIGWSPDGEYLIYAAFEGARSSIKTVHIESGTTSTILPFDYLRQAGGSSDFMAMWVPNDDRILVYFFNVYVYLLGTVECSPTEHTCTADLTDDRVAFNWAIETYPTVSPSGDTIAAGCVMPGSKHYEMCIWDMAGNLIHELDPFQSDKVISLPAWSPDGTRMAFIANGEGSSNLIYVLDLASREVTAITSNDLDSQLIGWLR
jgi:hypothetical protein